MSSSEVIPELIQPVPIPDRVAVRQFFTELLGRDVTAKDAPGPMDPSGCYIGEYVDDEGTVLALFLADPVFAAASGASLMMMPAGIMDDIRKGETLSGTLLDCFKEVVNIYSRLMNSPDSPHLRLRDLFGSPAEVNDESRAILTMPCRRADLLVNVPGYGEGRLSMLLGE